MITFKEYIKYTFKRRKLEFEIVAQMSEQDFKSKMRGKLAEKDYQSLWYWPRKYFGKFSGLYNRRLNIYTKTTGIKGLSGGSGTGVKCFIEKAEDEKVFINLKYPCTPGWVFIFVNLFLPVLFLIIFSLGVDWDYSNFNYKAYGTASAFFLVISLFGSFRQLRKDHRNAKVLMSYFFGFKDSYSVKVKDYD